MYQCVSVNRICAEVLCHLANQAFANRDIARQADDVFIWKSTHVQPSFPAAVVMMSFTKDDNDKSNSYYSIPISPRSGYTI